jgi:hypothetical protein|tara:strand:+ start:655 stop:798 length:144 start_codon:yes stop_codon:yes gene_type:complete
MEVFGIIGMSMGTMGFIFALSALDQVSKLKKQLTESGALPQEQIKND